MINSITMLSHSPVMGRSRREETGLINSLITDDNEKVFPIQIEYVFHKNNGVAVVYSHDYKLCPDANISRADLVAFCEQEIKSEHRLVEFF